MTEKSITLLDRVTAAPFRVLLFIRSLKVITLIILRLLDLLSEEAHLRYRVHIFTDDANTILTASVLCVLFEIHSV